MSHDETLRKTIFSAPTDSRFPASAGQAWAWVTGQGAAEWASPEQLAFWLGRGELSPQTRVWKPGWREWRPALQVAELAVAFSPGIPGEESAGRNARDPSVTTAPPSSPTLVPHALELAPPDLLAASPTPQPSSTLDRRWPVIGALVLAFIAVLSLGSSWAAFSLAMLGLKPVEPPALEDPPSAQAAATGSSSLALSPAEEPAGAASAEAVHTASPVQLPAAHEPAVLRVSDLPKPGARALPPPRRTPADPHASAKH